MEENENKVLDVTEEENAQPTREEILAISREENKNGDEREKQLYKSAIQIAYSVGSLLTGIIVLVSSVFDKVPAELMIIYTAMTGTMALYCGIKFTKRKRLFLACGGGLLAICVFFIVYWILGLCGVLS